MQLQPRPNDRRNTDALEPFEGAPIPVYESLYPYFGQEESPIWHYLRLLRKRCWWILATFAIVFALSAIATLRATRLYQATSEVAVFSQNPNILGFKDFEDGNPVSDYDNEANLETQAAILRSDALAAEVITAMHLDQDARFTGIKASAPSSDVIPTSGIEPDPAKAAGLLGAFDAGLSVQVIPNSHLIQVSYTHSDPQLAAEIANSLVRTFIAENFKTKYQAVTQASDWLSKELADLQLRVQTSEEKLVRYQKAHSIVGIDDKQNIVTAKLNDLNEEVTKAESDRIQKETDYRLAVEGDPASFEKGEDSTGLMAKLEGNEADLETQYAQITTQFGSGYPKVEELGNQLKQVRKEMADERTRTLSRLRDRYLSAIENEKMLGEEFDQQKKQANQLNESAIDYSILKRDAESNRELYDNLQQRLKEAGVSAGLKSSNIRVVDMARTPTSPVAPRVGHNLMLGFLGGLAAGIALAFVLENMDKTVRSVEEVSVISTLPSLGAIPLQASRNGHIRTLTTVWRDDQTDSLALVAHARPKSGAAEAYRALRTAILLSTHGAPPRVILVTSPSPQEGKTTITANAAVVLAQSGRRVLLVDADLRRPGLERMLGLRSKGGLSTLISGVEKAEEVILPFTEVPNLWVLPSGPIPPQPAELLGSNVMREQISRWRDEFDHVVIDTPPCLSVTDAAVLSASVDRILLVARYGQTSKPALRRACGLLKQVNARVLGVVLNAFDQRADGYYYYYGGRSAGEYYDDDSSSNGNSARGSSTADDSLDSRVS
jgi:capsular exopolysaccharide synthesis family protein